MGEEAKLSEARRHPDRTVVYAAGLWGESHAPYLGRSVHLPTNEASRVARRCDGWAEVSRGQVTAGAGRRRAEHEEPTWLETFDARCRRRQEGWDA